MWAAPDARPLRLTGSGLIDVAYWKQKNSLAVHVVNLTNLMAMNGRFRELIQVDPLTLHVDLPAGLSRSAVKLLPSESGRKMDQFARRYGS